MKVRNRIVNYLRGDRRGKEANGLEREALNDAFLYEALEGLTGMQRDVVRDIEYLSKRLRERTRSKWRAIGRIWGIVATVVVVGLGMMMGFRQMQADSIQRQKNQLFLTGGNGRNGSMLEGENLLGGNAEQQQMNGKPDTVRMVQKSEAVLNSSVSVRYGKGDTVVEGNKGSLPFGGYKKFYRYVRDSLRYPQDALERGLEGEIKLSFYVNKAGRPSHIRVVKWISYSCNREAIRLLCEGPAWNYTGDTSYVVIPFCLKK